MNGRRATVELTYNGIPAPEIGKYLSSFRYTDVASGSSDSISIELSDRDRKWINGWFPKKGDRLKPMIVKSFWDRETQISAGEHFGTFVIDSFSFRGGPIQCSIEATAMPSTSGFKATERTQTFENTKLRDIGATIAYRNGLKLYYEGYDVYVENAVQDKKSDCRFFSELVTKYGLALKIYNSQLVVFDEAAYEGKRPKAVLTEADIEPGWSWNTSLLGTYTGVRYQYTHAKKGKTFSVDIGGGGRILYCDDEANNQTEATLIALAKVNGANKKNTTMRVSLMSPSFNINATDCVMISGLGNLSGKYYVEKAVHTIGSGSATSLELRKVEKRFTMQEPPAPTPVVRTAGSAEERQKAAVVYRKGDRVRVVKGAKSYSGGTLGSYVYTTVYDVIQVSGNGSGNDRVVIGQGEAITAAVRAADLYRV